MCIIKRLVFEFQIGHILLNSSEKLCEFNRICLIWISNALPFYDTHCTVIIKSEHIISSKDTHELRFIFVILSHIQT